MNKKESLINSRINDLLSTIKEGDGYSIYVHVCKEDDNTISSLEAFEGVERSLFASVLSLYKNDKNNLIKNIISNVISFMTNETQSKVIKINKSKGDA